MAALLGTSACNLDFEPKSDVTGSGFWEKEEAVRSGYTGVMEAFRDKAEKFFELGELRSDAWGGKTMESLWNIDLMSNDYTATKTFYENWADFYGLIHYMNDFLANSDKATFVNESDRSNLRAQVHGMRAFVYYTMLKTWGDVILTAEPLASDKVSALQSLRRKRSSKEEVMKFILDDIAKSLEYYSQPGVNALWRGSSVYWSKAATLTLQGDVLLWKGQVLGGGEADFRAAKEALNMVATGQAGKTFQLVPYENLWGAAHDNNAEFVFALDYAKDQDTHFYPKSFAARSVDLKGKFSQSGESLEALGFSGGNHQGPSDRTLNLLYSSEDKRQATFALVFDTKDAQDLKTLTNENNEHYKGAILRKFWGKVDADGTRLRDENIPIYRYADVLLLLAEAKNQLGEDPSAEINQVRTRAGVNTMYTNGTKLDNKRAILDERFKEFVGEGKRWWDLVRAGDGLLFEYVNKIPASEPFRIYLPITKKMIDADPEYIKQTEGY